MKHIYTFLFLFIGSIVAVHAQGILGGTVTGNFQLDGQISKKDSLIGAPDVPQKFLSNAYANILYTNGDFTAGLRFESYLDPLLGFDSKYKGAGFPYKFVSYKKDKFEITAGNFYEQYGNGLIFRSYEEKNLGLDNAMNGVNVKFMPIEGIVIKGMVGQQRYYWENTGLIRGIDGDFMLNSLIPGFQDSKLRIGLGGSFVSKYEESEEILDNTGKNKYNLPLNVGAGAGRINLAYQRFVFEAEYARKAQDPNNINKFIYKEGDALFLSGSYSQKGLGVNIQAKRIDNMSFKSKRTEAGEMLNINYLPALTKQHTYSLLTIYPYATQPNGEMGIQADVIWTIKKGTLLGGKYGTEVTANYSNTYSIDQQKINDTTAVGASGTNGYKSNFFKTGDEQYYQDFNISIARKFTKDFKATLTYSNLTFNPIALGHAGEPMVYANIVVLEGLYKLNSKNVLRGELQWLGTKQDNKDWAYALLEYNFKSNFFVSVSDQWNYGNDISDKRIHYYNISAGYTHGSSRLQLSYGKQREGIICIGGVCRPVPASNGFMISLSSSF